MSLAGAPVTLSLSACEAQGIVFAVSNLDVGDPSQVNGALQSLQSAAMANMPALETPQVVVAQMSGMTPQPGASQVTWRSRLADGRTRRVHAIWVSRGTVVIQATLIGSDERIVDRAWQPFLEGLSFVP